MIIDALFEEENSVYRYDTDTGRLLHSNSQSLVARLIAEGVIEATQDVSRVAPLIYESERVRTRYSSTGKSAINQRMRAQSVLFGRPRPLSVPPLAKACAHRTQGDVFQAIRFVFRNIEHTPWAIDGLGAGVRRIYPSNGAIHSLECCYTDAQGQGFIYDSYRDQFFLLPPSAATAGQARTLLIRCDFERLAERYRDVRSLSALYIELGHCTAALFQALHSRGITPVTLDITEFETATNDHRASLAAISL